MAKIVCTLKEFVYFIDPRIKLNIANMTRRSKVLLDSKCQKCHKKDTLDAAHKHGSFGKDIVKNVLAKYETSDEKYEIEDLQGVLDEIKDMHLPMEEHFVFLCKSCHREYDSWTKNLDYMKEIPQNTTPQNTTPQNTTPQNTTPQNTTPQNTTPQNTTPQNTTPQNTTPQNTTPQNTTPQNTTPQNTTPQNTTPKMKKSTQINNKGVKEILCKNETASWRYKIGWVSMNNRKNILELISKIESNFDCYPLAFKSWYYHKLRDNDKLFSAILTNKDDSVICFRVDPRSFTVDDPRIIHGKRWFFPEVKEKRIQIAPENHELIMQCLSHAFETSKHMYSSK